ncbi:MAG: hypothetical protein Q8R18_01465, partial [bacterium]|nr:hypothetical protein [bacterium]
HGSGDAFIHVMKMLADANIKETKVYVLNPEYVQKNTKEGAIGRASWLDFFDDNSNFNADGRSFNYNSRLRGVRRRASVSEPGAHEVRDTENPYTKSYETLLAHPEQAVAALDDNTASALENLLSQYRREAKQ